MVPGFHKQLVMAFFEKDAAASALGVVEKAPAVTAAGCTVGLLSKDKDGNVIASRLGPRVVDDAAAVGAVLGVIAWTLTGAKVPREVDLLSQGSELSADDIARFAAELDADQAAVSVLGDPVTVEPAVLELARLGGKTEMHGMTREFLEWVLSAPAIVW